MEPPAPLEEEFNDWYDIEHFPQRRSLPGFESASRWVCLSGWPRWLAIYDLSSTAALATPEYAAVSGDNSTPWSRRMLPRTIGRQRIVAEQIHPGDSLAAPPDKVTRLCVAHYPEAGESAVDDLARATADLDGLLQLRLFRDTAGGLWSLAAFVHPTDPARIDGIFGGGTAGGARLLNLYAPYRRD